MDKDQQIIKDRRDAYLVVEKKLIDMFNQVSGNKHTPLSLKMAIDKSLKQYNRKPEKVLYGHDGIYHLAEHCVWLDIKPKMMTELMHACADYGMFRKQCWNCLSTLRDPQDLNEAARKLLPEMRLEKEEHITGKCCFCKGIGSYRVHLLSSLAPVLIKCLKCNGTGKKEVANETQF